MVPARRGRVPAPTVRPAVALLLVLAAAGISGCDLIEGIFRVGLWVGVIIVLLVILLIWLITRLFR